MNKRKANARARKARKNKHPNPDGFTPIDHKTFKPLGGFGGFADAAATLAVSMALSGATMAEKMMVAAFIPTLLKIMRTVPKGKLEELVIAVHKKENDELHPHTEQ